MANEDVMNTQGNGFPDEWLKITSRADGGKKAAIMYYADVSPLFTDGEKMPFNGIFI